MKTYIIIRATALVFSVGFAVRSEVHAQTTIQGPATIATPAISGAGETPLTIGVADAPGSSLKLASGTSVDGQFQPVIIGTVDNNPRPSLGLLGIITAANDIEDPKGGVGTRPIITVSGRRTDGSAVTTRPIFAVQNLGAATLQSYIMEVRPNGDVAASGNFISSTSLVSSDERFKADIKPLDNGLALIKQLNGRTYSFKKAEFADRSFPNGRMKGFIAQELVKVMPEAVVKQADGYYAVNYDAVVPVLVEAVKQLDAKQAETSQLQQQITALQAQVALLQAAVQKVTGKAIGASGSTNFDASQFSLGQNVPNPSPGASRIDYSLPAGASGAVITVYDLQGKTLKTFADLTSGQPQTIELPAGTLPAGLYIYKLTVNGAEIASKRMQLSQ